MANYDLLMVNKNSRTREKMFYLALYIFQSNFYETGWISEMPFSR